MFERPNETSRKTDTWRKRWKEEARDRHIEKAMERRGQGQTHRESDGKKRPGTEKLRKRLKKEVRDRHIEKAMVERGQRQTHRESDGKKRPGTDT
ncbi:hypothetical protein RRG08_058726 [Elysia crispata]|uniref:Uncharacterized protein n=1 Tax=Elysia crispata TaxID=231223 RepID=A0AAE0YXQ2_9GAST|nr:hypothetical protein RRG08_058726 [Elysia crispata]